MSWEILTFLRKARRLGTLETLIVGASESGRINGDACVALALKVDRFVLTNDFAPKLEWSTLIGHLNKFRLVEARCCFTVLWRGRELAVSFLYASLYHGLQ